MAESAERIQGAAPHLDLDAAERAEFLRLAGRLRQQALELAEAAPRLSPPEIRARAESIEATCARCHDRFRIPREQEGPG